jgi:tRNA-Thr(GGU) m(6)t(6)A37 methyltransferase TsaA
VEWEAETLDITAALSLLVVFAPAELERLELAPIGSVRSSLTRREDAPMQGHEGAPDAWLEIDARASQALHGISVGQELWLVTWLHQADRGVLQTHPRDDRSLPLLGVFATRSPDRPNPLGLHRVEVIEIRGAALRVGPLEAIDGTPVVDLKPVIGGEGD